MRDLRKKALLESGKTMSRKARTREVSNFGSTNQSPLSSSANSRPGSRAPSRYASEDEDTEDEDVNDSLTNSVIHSDDGEDVITDWTDRLKDCISEILDRKRSSVHGRESYMAAYVHLTRHHFADTIIESHLYELIPALLKSIRSGRNTEEKVAALKALTMTMLSTQSDGIYDQVFSSLKSASESSDEEIVKVEAINTMTVATMFGGGMEAAAEDLMDFLLEIIESDGHHIEAGDNGPVVSTALTCWGFLASHLDDLQSQSEQAIEAFTEQLDSTDVDVQIAAGTNVALIFEVNKKEFKAEPFQPYDLQYNQHQLVQRMTELAKESSKAVSKRDRRQLHARFASIVTSLESGKGPGYSKAGRVARESDRGGARVFDAEKVFSEFGYRETIRDQNMSLTIDSWSLSIRVAFLKKVLGGGFLTHWSDNPTVQESFDTA
ncbi:interferon-related developmental regulator-domain-containing protein [Pseudomassariella vexata]|uniref:Interferon-related developmental regulator-domain-containing protein n=1 Tax=Pseudomassariella vexata TaxID=1141098 RepID=A0A1Y2EBI2_9PEZI|nr:interferon-related developmental regulator-domain-containing protein [Pseudomassariella vexata]ORY68922.1 interferon-related developmental regulator-domain-containing protein [Pseudomassariella vexata]